jgi:regulator of protease activity HflC (stomatin/prohibitin superfamily)
MPTDELKNLNNSDLEKNQNEEFVPADQAGKALVDALQISFKILKFVMIVLLIFYIFSGTFQVKPEQTALVLRFGNVVGTGPDRELKQGIHFAWPYPIDRTIKVEKNQRTLNTEFWYQMTEQEKIEGRSAAVGASLVPGKDSYIITGDANILHISLTLKYRVLDAFDYVRTIENADTPQQNAQPEGKLLSMLADSSIIESSSQFLVDDLLGPGQTKFATQVKTYMQEKLRKINSGIQLEEVLIRKINPPRQVEGSFIEVRAASEQKFGSIQTAQGDAAQKLTQTAGMGYQKIIDAIHQEKDLEKTNDPKLQKNREEVKKLLDQAEGTVQNILAKSKIYRTKVVETAKADAEYLNALRDQFLAQPRVVLTRLLLGAMETTLPKVRKWYMPRDVNQIRFMLERDPEELTSKSDAEQNYSSPAPSEPPPMGPPPGPPGR